MMNRDPARDTARSGARLAINALQGVSRGTGTSSGGPAAFPPVCTTTPDPDDDRPVHVAMTILDTTLDPHAVTFIRPPR